MIGTESVEVTRVLPAPIDEVFRWWTEPELLARWMSPVGQVEAEADLRVGGRLRIVMRDGPIEIEHNGKFVEIDRPRRVVFTWESRFTAGPNSHGQPRVGWRFVNPRPDRSQSASSSCDRVARRRLEIDVGSARAGAR